MHADHDNILRRLKIVRGQVEGLIHMVEEDRYCIDISTQCMAASQALRSINRDVLSAHMTQCMIESAESDSREEIELKLREMNEVIQTLSK
ncbi:MAG: metal-sensing transcriptional repressor [Peptoniphilaceae bacterium]|nr:metal-sensing transcriptional repressor [Peptoniphilaceae bacterium]MDY6085910.1 metal-sensing transcriptional repressor [Peptoniphilaceae bacterium]